MILHNWYRYCTMSRYTCLLVTLSWCFNALNAVPQNVAKDRNVTAMLTCGTFGDETYYNHTESVWSSTDREPKTCTSGQFSAQYMVDGSADTFWQSTSRSRLYDSAELGDDSLDTVLQIDLLQVFEVQQINLLMSDSKRPNHIALYKSHDGVSWFPVAYKVTLETECQAKFGVALSSKPTDTSGYVCSSYSRPMANQYEEITFDFTDIYLQEWKLARFLKVEFFQIHLTLGISGDKFQHYTVSELEVLAECTCNGLDSACLRSTVTDLYACVCGDNSQGEFCESCLPLYNQQQYQRDTPCDRCECFGHADSCVFNETIAMIGLSLDAQLDYHGGGVCQNCTAFTSGINCETCEEFYYRPAHLSQNDTSPCQPCQCSIDGVNTNPVTSLIGDCVINNDNTTSLQLNNQLQVMSPGDCYCKEKVYGSNCDRCLPNYYNLTAANPQGCQECECFTSGTVNSSNLCDEVYGNCTCKPHVQGILCDQCMDGYHSLTQNNTDGCDSCNCDIGASYSAVCNKISSQCDCKPITDGFRCESMLDGYYYPDFDTLRVEPEDFSNVFEFNSTWRVYGEGFIMINDSWSAQFSFPAGPDGRQLVDRFIVFIRYRAEHDVSTEVNMAIQTQVLQYSITHTACPSTWCYSSVLAELINSTTGDTTFLSITVNDTLILDSIILLPHQYETGNSDGVSVGTPEGCDLSTRKSHSPLSQECEAYIYSMSMLYYDTGFPCDCDTVGSVSAVCSQRGGDCTCKPGVGDRQCDSCLPGYYNFTDSGCTACECAGPDQRCDVDSGACTCPPTTQGHLCDECIEDHWDWSPTGCQACGCHPEGSVNSQCDLYTGVCECSLGVGDDKCRSCLPQYYNFTTQGCTECGCDETGSVDNLCHNVTGQCNCKGNVIGRECEQCADNSYYFGADDSSGCIQCDCMGISTQCNSYGERINEIDLPLLLAEVTDYNQTSVSDPQFRVDGNMSVTVSSSDQYLTLSNLGADNYLEYYGSVLTVTYQPSPILVSSTQLRFYLRNERLSQSNTVYHQVDVMQGVQPSLLFDIPLRETDWLLENGNNPDRGEFLAIIQSITSVLLPLNLGVNTIRVSNMRIIPDNTSSLIVEDCLCGDGYLGTSCEECMYGYTRLPSENTTLGLCVPCACNSHSPSCDFETGECIQCQDNTTGFHCELCVDGYYGDAERGFSDDCLPCPCYQPGISSPSCDTINNTVVCGDCKPGYVGELCDQCDDFYWWNGTVCTSCDCNGNSNYCHYTTGECIDCMNNTTGWYCEMCDEGYYGNATIQDCSGCGCDDMGSIHTVCDHMTGNCVCKDHVTSRQCDMCEHAYWGFSVTGCTDCDCVASGSLSAQCDLLTGVCDCRQNATGDQCELCALGSFGLPDLPCQDCSCNETGSLNHTLPCDVYNGTCDCEDGVAGRQCDQCMDMYYNFTSTGCSECGICEKKLGDTANTYLAVSQQYVRYGNNLLNMISNHQRLINLTQQVRDDMLYITETATTFHQEIMSMLSEVSNLSTVYHQRESTLISHLSESSNSTAVLLLALESMYESLITLQHRAVNVSASLDSLGKAVRQSQEDESELMDMLEDGLEYWNEYWSYEDFRLALALTRASDIMASFQELNTGLQSSLKHATTTHRIMVEQTLSESESAAYNYSLLHDDTTLLDNLINEQMGNVMNMSEFFNNTMVVMSYVGNTYLSASQTLNHSSFMFERVESLLNNTDRNVPDLFLEASEKRNELNSTLEELRLDLNISQLSLPELRQKVAVAEEVAVNSSSLLNNLTMADLSSVNIYNTYQNVSLDLNNSLHQANQLVASLLNLSGSANVIRVGMIEQLQNNTNNELLELESDLASIMTWANESSESIAALNSSYNNQSEIWSRLVNNVTKSEEGLETVIQDTINNTELINIVNGKLVSTDEPRRQAQIVSAQLTPILNSYESLTLILRNTSAENTLNAVNLSQNLQNLNNSISNTSQVASVVSDIDSDHTSRLNTIKRRLAALRSKLAQVKQWSQGLNTPVKIEANNSVSTTVATNSSTELQIDAEFSLSSHEDQVLLHLSSPHDSFEMMMTFIQGALEVRSLDKSTMHVLKGRAFICVGCWTRVQISRYGSRLTMSVSDLDYRTQPILDETELVNSTSLTGDLDVIVGSISQLSNFNHSDTWSAFEGCMGNVKVKAVPILLASSSDNSSCCPTVEDSITQTSVMSLNGFGYAHVAVQPSDQPSMSVSMRSYSPDGEIITFISANRTVAMLSLERGKISLRTEQESGIVSSNYYNYGEWVSINCSTNNTTLTCVVSSADLSDTLIAHIQVNEAVDSVTLGSVLEETDRFAGCLANLTVNGHLVNAWKDVTEYSSLLPYCYNEVLRGLSLTSGSSLTVQPTLIVDDLYHVTVDLITRDLTGSLLYMSSGAVTVEMGLLQSYLVVVISNNDSREGFVYQKPLSDYKMHTISVNVVNNSRRVMIDGTQAIVQTHIELPDNISSSQGRLFQIGRFLSNNLMFTESLDVGVTRMVINEWTLPLLTTSIYSESMSARLTGIPSSVDGNLLLSDLITSPPPPTSPRPTCAPPGSPPQISPVGMRFGDESLSYATFELGADRMKFNTSAAVNVRFRALTSTGLLFYVADTVISPNNWMSLYLHNGHLVFNVQTSSMRSTAIQSNYRYDDGQWWDATLLRLNNFMALVVNGRLDYINNDGLLQDTSHLLLGIDLYVGGLSTELLSTLPSSIVGESFHGCVDFVSFSSSISQETITFNLTSPTTSVGTRSCYKDVQTGVYLQQNSYIHVASGVNVSVDQDGSGDFDFGFKVRSNERSYLLFTVYDARCYMLAYVNQSQVTIVLGHFLGGERLIFSSTVDTLLSPNLCDAVSDLISVRVISGVLHLSVSRSDHQWSLEFQQPWMLRDAELFVGGLPDGNVNLPSHMITSNLQGCLDDLKLNGNSYEPGSFVSSFNTTIGCFN